MSTELHLTIKADSASDALQELAEISVGAGKELGVAPQSPDKLELPLAQPDKGNGEDAPTTEKRTRKRAAAPPAGVAVPNREEIIKSLTDLYMGGNPTVRERITAFRDGYGAQRLRELKDEVLPEAMELLTELKSIEAAGP